MPKPQRKWASSPPKNNLSLDDILMSPDRKNDCISIYFDPKTIDADTIATLIFALEKLYKSVGGDELKII